MRGVPGVRELFVGEARPIGMTKHGLAEFAALPID
jgi:hypothetical protein